MRNHVLLRFLSYRFLGVSVVDQIRGLASGLNSRLLRNDWLEVHLGHPRAHQNRILRLHDRFHVRPLSAHRCRHRNPQHWLIESLRLAMRECDIIQEESQHGSNVPYDLGDRWRRIQQEIFEDRAGNTREVHNMRKQYTTEEGQEALEILLRTMEVLKATAVLLPT